MERITPYTLSLLIAFLLFGCTASQVNQAIKVINDAAGGGDQLTTNDVASGLKEALEVGITKGANKASATDGFFKNSKIKIPFPPEVQKVEEKLRQIGLGNKVDEFVLSLNRGAEEAAKEAKPIFVSAIKGMTIDDAWGILKGEDDAATTYLENKTSAQLYDKFLPVVQNALNKVNATKYYSDLVNTYNKIPFVEKVNPDLDDYATNKAIDGLFFLVEEEEGKIRKDPVARTTELLKKVFKEQD